MEEMKTKFFKKIGNLQIFILINFFFSAIVVYLDIKGYFNYKQMQALNVNSFIYMGIIELIIISGLVLMFFEKENGFYTYIIGQLLSIIYPIVSGTGDTVLGLLTLPLIVGPVFFAIYYFRNLKNMH